MAETQGRRRPLTIATYVQSLVPDKLPYLLMRLNLISSSKICVCGGPMKLEEQDCVSFGYSFHCNECHTHRSALEGSFFANSSITVQRIMIIIYFFVTEAPVIYATRLADVTKKSAIHWYQRCRDVCTKAMLKCNPQFGGPGRVVQVADMSVSCREGNHGGVKKQVWVLGIYDPLMKRSYFTQVKDRESESLLPEIRRLVFPGSAVVTDEWRGYDEVGKYYDHRVVNRSQNLVDSVTGLHIQDVVAYWNRLKRHIRNVSGLVDSTLSSHLSEAQYRDWFGMTDATVGKNLKRFISDVAEQYPPVVRQSDMMDGVSASCSTTSVGEDETDSDDDDGDDCDDDYDHSDDDDDDDDDDSEGWELSSWRSISGDDSGTTCDEE